MKKATAKQIKQHNKRLILKCIYDGGGTTSRADVARISGLTRATVSDIVSQLMQEGLVEETGMGPSAGGKPPILLGVVDNSHHLIGIDLADSEFRGAIVNLRGEIIHRHSVPLNGRNAVAAIELAYDLIDHLIATHDKPVLGIGIGAPGLMDVQHGVVRNAINFDWQNLPLGMLLENRYKLPVYIANDCQNAALAETIFGAGKEASNLVVIRIGQGVGAGIVLNRQLFYGDDFGAGEIGHVVMKEDGEPCRCGNRGCLETIISSRALLARAQAYATDHPDAIFSQLARQAPVVNSDVLLQAHQAGDPFVQAIVEEAGKYLGMSIASLVSSLNIRQIIVAGSLVRFGDALLEPARQHVRHSVLSTLAENVQISESSLGQDIVILGAAALLLSKELGIV